MLLPLALVRQLASPSPSPVLSQLLNGVLLTLKLLLLACRPALNTKSAKAKVRDQW